MNIVITGHVDHGKSTLIGRLLADTHSLPQGKLESVKAMCAKNARPFEYAFLLDALADEQKQGITIDSARVFFNSKQREYIIIDAPGHIEFLKNMISGASRAEAALLLIDAKEGVAENSKRHGMLLSMLGIKQVAIVVNKMDLVDFSEASFETLKAEYTEYLATLGVKSDVFIPIAARDGVNLIAHSELTPWYKGPTVLEILDNFKVTQNPEIADFRMPLQDVYKFTADGDDRRIYAGTITNGEISIGDDVVFYPSLKHSTVASIESFNTSVKSNAKVAEAIGFTLQTQIYVKNGEVVAKASQKPPHVAHRFEANIFWLGAKALQKNKAYKIKIGSAKSTVYLESIKRVIDGDTLDKANEPEVARHEAASVVFRSHDALAMEYFSENQKLGRFVIVDGYDIAGGGIVTDIFEESGQDILPEESFEDELFMLLRKHFPHRFN
ncbi:MAG: GTP-binding protein [Sulfurospirillaceae bacterium]|nr:GTP-binding protein [Sulfurospirillaceae bacterium]MDD2825989.1 GTP-binding protein [Sulfurospirillaceae bacterium]